MRRVYLLMAVVVLCLGAETALAQEPARYIYSDVIFLGDDESNMTIDIGLIPNGSSSIGNFVWEDRDRDGIQNDGDDSGIEGVLVLLYSKEESGYQKAGQTYTDSKGYYLFENLPAGTYIVVVDRDTLPEELIPTTPHAPGSTNEDDSNAIGSTGTLPPE